jgi:hypothetical protein
MQKSFPAGERLARSAPIGACNPRPVGLGWDLLHDAGKSRRAINEPGSVSTETARNTLETISKHLTF